MTGPGRPPHTDVSPGAPAPAMAAVLAICVLQIALLTTGIGRDYRLKHEDNNALHATFARAHLRLGLHTTHAQNRFHNPHTGQGLFYPNHPPGPGLALAVSYGLTGSDGPLVTRATAIAFHLAGTWLFYLLARRVLRAKWEVLLALGIYALLPESAFFGRMMNHEVMVLPALILVVLGYWEAIRGTWPARRWAPAVALGALVAAISGWAGLFGIAACLAHAVHERFVRQNPLAGAPLLMLAAGITLLVAAVVGHLFWSTGVDMRYLRDLMASRSGALSGADLAARAGRILELHWRYFSLTSLVAVAAMAWRRARSPRAAVDPADDVGTIFLLAGAAYVGVFSLNASRHDYWQFLLLPAGALAVVLAVRWLRARVTRPLVSAMVIALAALEMSTATVLTLAQRHSKGEGYCIETVEQLRRDSL